LASILQHLQDSRATLLSVAEEVSVLRWREPPGPARWSAAEVIAHVTSVEERTIFGMKRLLRSAPQPVSLRKRFHLPLAIATWRGRKVRTPIPLDTNRVCDKRESFAGLVATRQATLEFIQTTRGTDVSAYHFEHPFLGNLNMYDWFRTIGYHELRHAKQIRELVLTFHD
jgi:DinB superfamily